MWTQEYLAWINGYLQRENERAIYDLRRAFADGVTLVKLLEIIAGQSLPGVQSRPILRLQKSENISRCLQFVSSRGVPVNGVKADDLVNGNLKAVITLCESLRQRHKNLSSSALLVDAEGDQGKSVSPIPADSLPGVLPEEPNQKQSTKARLHRDEPTTVAKPHRSSLPASSSNAELSVTSKSQTASSLSGHRGNSLSALTSQRPPARTEAWATTQVTQAHSSADRRTNGTAERNLSSETDGLVFSRSSASAPQAPSLSKMSSMASQVSVDAQCTTSPVEDRLKQLLDADNPMVSPVAFSPLTTVDKLDIRNGALSDNMVSPESGGGQLMDMNSQLAQLTQGIRTSLHSGSQSIPTRRGASVAPAATITTTVSAENGQVTKTGGIEEPVERVHSQAAGAEYNLRLAGKTKSHQSTSQNGSETGKSPPKSQKKSLFDSLRHSSQRKQLGVVPERSSPTESEDKPPPLPQTEPPDESGSKEPLNAKKKPSLVESVPKPKVDSEGGPELVPIVKVKDSVHCQRNLTSPPTLSGKPHNGGSLEKSPTSAFQQSSPVTTPIRPQPVLAQANLGTDHLSNGVSGAMLLQKLSLLEDQQQAMQEAFQTERKALQTQLAAQQVHIQHLEAQALQRRQRYIQDRRLFLSRMQGLEGQLVGVARSTAYLATQVQNSAAYPVAGHAVEQKTLATSLHEIREMLDKLEKSAGEDSSEDARDRSSSSTDVGTPEMTRKMALQVMRSHGTSGTPNTQRRQDWQAVASISPLQYWSPGCDAHYDVVKVKKFFGQEPPRLLRQFLKRMGYEHLAKKFEKHRVGLLELPHLTEEQLKKMKIPAGPRMRILHELEIIQQSAS